MSMADGNFSGKEGPGGPRDYHETSFLCVVAPTAQVCFFPTAIAAEVGPLWGGLI